MTVQDIIKLHLMPCNSIAELKAREEVLKEEYLQKRMDNIIDSIDITEIPHPTGHPADEIEYDKEHYYYDQFDHIHVIDD